MTETGDGTSDRGVVLEMGALVLLTLGSLVSWVGWVGGVLLRERCERANVRDHAARLGTFVERASESDPEEERERGNRDDQDGRTIRERRRRPVARPGCRTLLTARSPMRPWSTGRPHPRPRERRQPAGERRPIGEDVPCPVVRATVLGCQFA
jgi:hypothetical protein